MDKSTDRISYQIQRLVMPNLDFGGAADIYVRTHRGYSTILHSEQTLLLSKNAICSFDTFYNGLTIQSWKENCGIETLAFCLKGRGRVVIRLVLRRLDCDDRYLAERQLALEEGCPARLDVSSWPELVNGMLYAEIEALEDAAVTAGWFETATPPRRDVRLGIVITHFKREKAVRQATRRIRDGLAACPEYDGKIGLVVVDNSRTLSEADTHGAVLLPNRNLGGSGGFTRGLLHLKDDGGFTHCLFMDDDASCEMESIFRTYALLSYATIERMAVAGALLRALAPHFLFEKGALFDGMCRPLHHGLDIRNGVHLLLSDFETRRPDFGGWWFFAFALADVKHYAFPFFVRGDDIMFGMMNCFTIVTQNGIASYGDDFGYKSGPLQIYLDVRNHLVQKMTHMNATAENCLRLLDGFFDAAIGSYNYATARAISLAIRDVMQGHGFWVRNIDMAELRRELAPLTEEEKMRPMRLTDIPEAIDQVMGGWSERFRRFVIRRLTLNGAFLPRRLRKYSVLMLDKNFAGDPRATFRYEKVLYYYKPTQEGYIARRNLARRWEEKKIFTREKRTFQKNYARIKQDYQDHYLEMTSEAFWRGIYREDQG